MLDSKKTALTAVLIATVLFSFSQLTLADDGDTNPGVIPPLGPGSEANVLPGWGGSLAYSPASDQWLVTSPSGNYIWGQMMNEKNKTVGSQFKISVNNAQSGAPKVAYDPLANKFLVVWVDYSNNTATIYGQFIDPKGALLGSNFKVISDTILLDPESLMQFDATNKKFVFGWGNAGISACLITVDEQGKAGQPICVKGDGAEQTFDPFIAVNPKSNEYCLAYSWYGVVRGTTPKSGSVGLRSINAATGAVGPESLIADDVFHTQGLIYDSQDDQYVAFWTDAADFANQPTYSKTTPTCGDGPNASKPQLMSNGAGLLTVSYNPTSNAIAYIGQSYTDCDLAYIFDASSGNSIGTNPISIFCGTTLPPGKGGNFSPVIAPNSTTGTFAAISSEDRKQTKFIANLGWPDVTVRNSANNSGPSQPLTARTQGLPTDLGQFISAIFVWSLRIIGLIVFIRFFWAGFKWFTAAGNSGSIKDAQEIMKNAALGAVVLFAAYLILYSINPDLVKGALNLPGVSSVPGQASDVCVHKGFCAGSGEACSYAGDNALTTDCFQDDTCQANAGNCKVSGKICSADTDCK